MSNDSGEQAGLLEGLTIVLVLLLLLWLRMLILLLLWRVLCRGLRSKAACLRACTGTRVHLALVILGFRSEQSCMVDCQRLLPIKYPCARQATTV